MAGLASDNVRLDVQKGCYSIYCDDDFQYHEQGVQHYVIKFVSDLRQVGGFLRVLQFPSPIKLTAATM